MLFLPNKLILVILILLLPFEGVTIFTLAIWESAKPEPPKKGIQKATFVIFDI